MMKTRTIGIFGIGLLLTLLGATRSGAGREGRSIEGVTLLEGKPAAKVHILLREAASGFGDRPALAPRESVTDARGRFRFGGLQRGRYDILAQSPKGAAWITVEADSAPVEIELEPGGQVVGVVRDQDGHAMEGVEVALVREAISLATKTGKMGDYWFRDLPEGLYDVAVRKRGYVDVSKEASLLGGQARVDVALSRKAVLQGTVHEANGEAVAGVDVRAYCQGRERDLGTPDAETRSDPKGAFRLEVAPGECRIGLGSGDLWRLTAKDVAAPAEVELVPPRRRSIQVEVVDEQGAPVPEALLEVRHWLDDLSAPAGKTGTDGRATLVGLRTLEAGRYTVRAMGKQSRLGADGKPDAVSLRTAWGELDFGEKDPAPIRLTLRGSLQEVLIGYSGALPLAP
jgi:hypothetical protein